MEKVIGSEQTQIGILLGWYELVAVGLEVVKAPVLVERDMTDCDGSVRGAWVAERV